MSAAQRVPAEVRRAARSGARLAAVQALYQLEHSGQSAKAVIRDFMEDRLGYGPDGEPIEEADPDLFKQIVNAVIARQADVDAAITTRLAQGWRLSRLDATTRAILRCAAAELLGRPETPTATVADEYVGVANAFFEDPDPKLVSFVNAVIDKLAVDLRPEGDGKEDPFAGV